MHVIRICHIQHASLQGIGYFEHIDNRHPRIGDPNHHGGKIQTATELKTIEARFCDGQIKRIRRKRVSKPLGNDVLCSRQKVADLEIPIRIRGRPSPYAFAHRHNTHPEQPFPPVDYPARYAESLLPIPGSVGAEISQRPVPVQKPAMVGVLVNQDCDAIRCRRFTERNDDALINKHRNMDCGRIGIQWIAL